MKSTSRRYVLAVLLVIYAFNYVDRFALGLLLQDIKVDLQLSDTQLGFLTGLAFAVFYSVLGIPIARWADRGNRVLIITVTTGLWSAALALCGMVGNFVQLLLIRIGVAVGEAGCVPPAQSLISDYFNRAERPRAMAIYMLGVPLSAVIGYLISGILNEAYGWRWTFVLLGVPGIALAALAWFTLREPRLQGAASQVGEAAPEQPDATPVAQPPLREVAATLWANVTFRHLLMCWSLVAFFGYGIWQWKPAFFVRSFGMNTMEVGLWFAMIYGVCAFVGLYGGGELASRHAANNERLQFRSIALAYCVFGAIQGGMFLVGDRYVAFVLLALSTIGIYTAQGPLFAAIQSLALPRMRAVAVAIIYLFANLIGLGLGPLAAGALSDALRPSFSEDSLRYSLLILCSGYLWAAWHLWLASRTVIRDLESVQRAQEGLAGPSRAKAEQGNRERYSAASMSPAADKLN